MTNKTHIMFGVAVNVTATYFLKDYINLDISHVLLGAIVGSQFPDLDSDCSWITQTIPYPYMLLKHTKKLYSNTHRTVVLHSIYTIIVMIGLIYALWNSLIIGFGVGLITHVITDNFIKCNSLAEKVCYHVSFVTIIILIIKEVYLIG